MANNVEKGVMSYVDKSIADVPSDRTATGIIVASTTTGYTVKIRGKDYTNVPTLTSGLVQYDTVKLCIPDNQYSNMFILGKLKLV